MVSNIRTNSSGRISTPFVAGLLYIIKIRIASPMLRKSLKKSRSESFQCDAGKIVTASAPPCCAQCARRVVFTVVGDTPES
jgi:hypothetical protein